MKRKLVIGAKGGKSQNIKSIIDKLGIICLG